MKRKPLTEEQQKRKEFTLSMNEQGLYDNKHIELQYRIYMYYQEKDKQILQKEVSNTHHRFLYNVLFHPIILEN